MSAEPHAKSAFCKDQGFLAIAGTCKSWAIFSVKRKCVFQSVTPSVAIRMPKVEDLGPKGFPMNCPTSESSLPRRVENCFHLSGKSMSQIVTLERKHLRLTLPPLLSKVCPSADILNGNSIPSPVQLVWNPHC